MKVKNKTCARAASCTSSVDRGDLTVPHFVHHGVEEADRVDRSSGLVDPLGHCLDRPVGDLRCRLLAHRRPQGLGKMGRGAPGRQSRGREGQHDFLDFRSIHCCLARVRNSRSMMPLTASEPPLLARSVAKEQGLVPPPTCPRVAPAHDCGRRGTGMAQPWHASSDEGTRRRREHVHPHHQIGTVGSAGDFGDARLGPPTSFR